MQIYTGQGCTHTTNYKDNTCTLLSPVIRAIKPKISVKPIPCRARATSMNLVRRAVRVCSDAILVRHRPTHWLRTWCLQAGKQEEEEEETAGRQSDPQSLVQPMMYHP